MSKRWVGRWVGMLSFVALAVVFLGCMSLSIGERTVTTSLEGDVLTQQGCVATLASKEEREVYYPIPYATPPNLELTTESACDRHDVQILEQKEDRFRIKAKSALLSSVTWKARGVRRPAPPAGPAPPEVVPPPELPPQPVAVEPPK